MINHRSVWLCCWMLGVFSLAAVGLVGCDDDPEGGETASDAPDTLQTTTDTSGSTVTDTQDPDTQDPTDTEDPTDTNPPTDTQNPTDTPTDTPSDTPDGLDIDIPDTTTETPSGDQLSWGSDTASVTITDRDTLTRTYRLSTTAALRDNDPSSKQINFSELSGQPVLRSGHDMFDALFALAVEETRQNSVDSISDGAFNNGQGVPCRCFETGAKWNYVWTRDTAYAADLGLPWIDPERTRTSLAFKLSARKDGSGDLQVVQDTGSGGSYPVSTDRAIWSLGAWETLQFLENPARNTFRDQMYDALSNMIAQDLEIAFDPRDGLYRGEQSFLDWREQSYPSWTAQDTVHLGMSKSLSTNIAHLSALKTAAALAVEKNLPADAAQFQQQADALSAAIYQHFWLADVNLLSGLKTTGLDDAPLHRYDLLGISLAILEGVVTPEQGALILSNYPHTSTGAPVIWPQQPLTAIYHNRALWPFVTAYTLRAAKVASHDAAFDAALTSLVRGAALNLSNMENFEFLTQAAWFDDGAFSGPVVNSRRQLWSVAGYIGAVVQGLYGIDATPEGLVIKPFVTQTTRNTWLRNTDAPTLHQLTYKGVTLDITLNLPPANDAEGGVLNIDSIFLNGQAVTVGEPIPLGDLQAANSVEVTLSAPTQPGQSLTRITDVSNFQNFWSPREPTLESITQDSGRLRLNFNASGEAGVVFNIFRDGQEVASGVTDTFWIDPDSAGFDTQTFCYAVEAQFLTGPNGGNRSHHSPPNCYWGPNSERIQTISTLALQAIPPKSWSSEHGQTHYSAWGDIADILQVSYLRPAWSGQQLLQVTYGNGAGGINTGITAALKRVEVERLSDSALVASGYVLMPQLGTWARWGESSLMPLSLDADEVYKITLRDAVNMSYFAHFVPYTGGTGGGATSFNQANIHAIKLLTLSGTPAALAAPLVAFDGVDDVAKLDVAQRITTPGAPFQPWSQFGFDWDDDSLFIAFVSGAFEDPYKPLFVYLEASEGALPPAQPSTQGLLYSNLTPELPFTPTHAISARRTSDSGSTDGPWNGVWERNDQGQLVRVLRLEQNTQWWIAADQHTLSLRIPRDILGNATRLRLSAHVVNAAVANEWKDTIPSTHTPWNPSALGFYEIDLTGAHPVANWTLR